MELSMKFNTTSHSSPEIIAVGAFCQIKETGKGKNKKTEKNLATYKVPKEWKQFFDAIYTSKDFVGEKGTHYSFPIADGAVVVMFGLGDKSKYDAEGVRRAGAAVYKLLNSKCDTSPSWWIHSWPKEILKAPSQPSLKVSTWPATSSTTTNQNQ